MRPRASSCASWVLSVCPARHFSGCLIMACCVSRVFSCLFFRMFAWLAFVVTRKSGAPRVTGFELRGRAFSCPLRALAWSVLGCSLLVFFRRCFELLHLLPASLGPLVGYFCCGCFPLRHPLYSCLRPFPPILGLAYCPCLVPFLSLCVLRLGRGDCSLRCGCLPSWHLGGAGLLGLLSLLARPFCPSRLVRFVVLGC